MSEYNIQMNKYNALNAEYDQLYPATKIKNVDGLNIALQNKADLGADGKVIASQLPSIEVDAYTKVQTLSDTTKTLFGLDATAVPDDALAVLSRLHKGLGNEYVWEKTRIQINHDYQENEQTNYTIGRLYHPSTSNNTTFYYGTAFDVNDKSFELKGESGSLVTNENTAINSFDILKGKYITVNYEKTKMYYVPVSATFTKDYSGNPTLLVASSCTYYLNPSTEVIVNSYGYVNSPDPNAYPPAVSDGYTYTALGQLGAGLKMDLLWENADISSTFPAQTLTMDLSKYKAVYICSVLINSVWDGTRGTGGSCVVRVGDASGLIGVCTWNGGLNSRFVHVTSSGITFGSGGYVNGSSDVRSSDHEGEAMPYKIYGIL